jgi:hypothetical protein
MANWNRIYWSVSGDPEDFTSAGSGYLDLVERGGAITGMFGLGPYFIVMQEKSHNIYSYQSGDNPLNYLRTIDVGCNYQKTAVEIDGMVYFLSDSGDIVRTNGNTSQILSRQISTITQGITNSRTVSDYYGTEVDCTPFAICDSLNNCYRLFYAGSSTSVNKCLTYWIDKDIWTSSSTIFGSGVDIFGSSDYIGMFGNSSGTGKTYYLRTDYSDVDKTGTLDLGFISSGDSAKKIKINYIDVWYHAQAGETSADDCDCTITLSVYKNQETNVAAKTITKTLAYNSTADNLLKKRFIVTLAGNYLRPVFVDSGSKRNYAIDKVEINFDVQDTV